MPDLLLTGGDVVRWVALAVFLVVVALVVRHKIVSHDEPHEREERIVAEGAARDRLQEQLATVASRLGLTYDEHCDESFATLHFDDPESRRRAGAEAKWAITGQLAGREVRAYFLYVTHQNTAILFWVAATAVGRDSPPLRLQPRAFSRSAETTGDPEFDATWKVDLEPEVARRVLPPDVTRRLVQVDMHGWLVSGDWLVTHRSVHVDLDRRTGTAGEIAGRDLPDFESVLLLLPDLGARLSGV